MVFIRVTEWASREGKRSRGPQRIDYRWWDESGTFLRVCVRWSETTQLRGGNWTTPDERPPSCTLRRMLMITTTMLRHVELLIFLIGDCVSYHMRLVYLLPHMRK